MSKNLVIVESPAKAKTIEKFLGKDFTVKSSYGHIRDLSTKDLGIDVEGDFTPNYEILADKKKIISDLSKSSKEAETVWLATDEDREGEAISWHLAEVLNLKGNVNRIVFNEITKTAIQEAIKQPRSIDINLVNAQQARRVLDRIVGFEISPILWRKVKPALSAGRVQSVAVRLIVEKEEEIKNFKSTYSYRVVANFTVDNKYGKAELKAELNHKFKTKEEALEFLEKCKDADFVIKDIVKKPSKRSPAPPFTTSTLQQEASRKLGFSVSRTMSVAQQLYESGKITYMRTDSVNLSGLAINTAKQEIYKLYGEEYHKARKYTTKTKGAQEAHEAIRPTFIDAHTVEGDSAKQKLYNLIWKRTIASQMQDASIETTTIYIDISNQQYEFVSKGQIVTFDGFLKVYLESTDDEEENIEGILPKVEKGNVLVANSISATQKFSNPPYRYTEASLVKKLEELGIGRPSTYAPTISTIQKREYVVKDNIEGIKRDFVTLTLKNKKITESVKQEISGKENGKLFPTDTGELVTKFLMKHFENIMNYNFTADVEVEFDKIAQGQKKWNEMIKNFYKPFHKHVVKTMDEAEKEKGERLLGTDPKTGLNVYVKLGRYGLIAQLGETESEEKPKFAGLKKGQTLENITLEEALKLLEFPKIIGKFEDADIKIGIGRFGPYIQHKSLFYSIKQPDNPNSIEVDRAIEIIQEGREKNAKKTIKEFEENPDIKVLNGRYGPYISYQKSNIKIPKTTDPATLTLQDCLDLIEKDAKSPKKGRAARSTTKTTKKKSAKK
ncbi:MAG: type I DNA topoisomerase [Lentimicrobiaceae bacterium]|nr:type I DNA topoisomerase [Lentimicrobiaceae bacterium]